MIRTRPRNFRCPHTGEPCERPDCKKKPNGKIACTEAREDRVRSGAAAEERSETRARAERLASIQKIVQSYWPWPQCKEDFKAAQKALFKAREQLYLGGPQTAPQKAFDEAERRFFQLATFALDVTSENYLHRELVLGRREAVMSRIAITPTAFEAITATPTLRSVDYILIAHPWLNKLEAVRSPAESYSDVILRLVETTR